MNNSKMSGVFKSPSVLSIVQESIYLYHMQFWNTKKVLEEETKKKGFYQALTDLVMMYVQEEVNPPTLYWIQQCVNRCKWYQEICLQIADPDKMYVYWHIHADVTFVNLRELDDIDTSFMGHEYIECWYLKVTNKDTVSDWLHLIALSMHRDLPNRRQIYMDLANLVKCGTVNFRTLYIHDEYLQLDDHILYFQHRGDLEFLPVNLSNILHIWQ